MDNDTKPSTGGQIKTLPRKDRGKAVYRPPASVAQAQLPATATTVPEVLNPDIAEHDIRISLEIKLESRMHPPFQFEDRASLPGLLDPANRGHMAHVVERRFEEMRDQVVRGFNKLIDQKAATVEPKAKPSAEEPRPVRKLPPMVLTGGSAGESAAEPEVAPLPKPPGTFHPPLNPVPPSTKN